MSDQKYIKNLEAIAKIITEPLKNLPFSSVIRLLSGKKVLKFNNKILLGRLNKAISLAGKKAYKTGIFAKRVNEVGNKIELFVKEAMNNIGLRVDTPMAQNGKRKATGYPDIEITDKNQTIYLECKTYNIKNVNTSQRAFYFSPSENFKITKDAPHLMLSFQVEVKKRKGRKAYVPVHWKLYTLENLKVDLKHEFNQSNKNLYASEFSKKALLAEREIR